MAIFSQYGSGQRFGFVFVCIGFTLCLIGSIAPYWLTAKTSVSIDDVTRLFGFNIGLGGDIKLLEVNAGVWYYCVKLLTEEKCDQLYNVGDSRDPDNDGNKTPWIQFVRITVVITIILSLLAGLVACCRCLCCSGGRTICHGVLSFIAGASGCCAFAMAYNNTNSLLDLPILDVEYGWAAWLFLSGSGLLIIASLLLCCGVPRESSYGMVLANPTSGISVNVSNTNTMTNTVNPYIAAGPNQGFEPLPNMPGPYNNYAPYPRNASAAYGYQPVEMASPPYTEALPK